MEDFRASSHTRRKRHARNIKTLDGRFCYVLGHDIFMDQVSSLCSRALVGRLEYCRLGKKAWMDWVGDYWKPLLTYITTIILLSNSWIVFVFLDAAHASLILEKIWRIGLGSLVLGRWHSHFDPLRERVAKHHLWVLLPHIPFPL